MPEQSGQGASEVSRSETVTPSIDVREPDASPRSRCRRRGAAAACGAGAAAAAEHAAEDVAEAAATAAATGAAAEQVVEVERLPAPAAAAAGRERPEAAAGRRAQLVVLLALLGVADDVVGLGDRLEAVLGGLVARVGVGVVRTGELAVGLLDVGRRASLATPRTL